MIDYRVTKRNDDQNCSFDEWKIDATDDIAAMRKVLDQEGYFLERMNEETGMYEPLFLN